jgi:hypothetical protein
MSSCDVDRARPGNLLAVGLMVVKTAMEDAHQPVGQSPKRLVMAFASESELVVVMPRPGERVMAQNAHQKQASASRRLRATRAKTAVRVPEVLVTGEVPAKFLRALG